jgi:hypothetical protein
MTQLQALDIGHTAVTDAGLKHLQGLARLESLTLVRSRVTLAGAEEVRRTLPKCRIQAF